MLDIVLWLYLLILPLFFARRRRRQTKGTHEELKLASRTTPHRLVLPGVHRYEYGLVEVARSSGLFAPEGEVKINWSGSKMYMEEDYVEIEKLCSTPPLVAKQSTELRLVMPAVRLRSGKYKDTIIACFNTEQLDATGHVYSVFENGFAQGYVRLSRGLLRAVLETSYAPVGEKMERRKVRLELCSTGKARTCSKLLETDKTGVLETSIHYPATRALIFGRTDGGFEDAFKIAEQLPQVLGPGLFLKLVIERGIFRRTIVRARLDFVG